MKIKRMLGGAVAVAAVTLGSAVPARAAADVFSFPTEWTVTSANCNQLPDGMSLHGTGTFTVIDNVVELPNGTTRWTGTGIAEGTAVDNLGNSYTWKYVNHWQERTSQAEPEVFRGSTVDHFQVIGSGPAAYFTGFKAAIEEQLGVYVVFTPDWVVGDPFDFDAPSGRCDPI